jgi:hypothetical protein
MALYADTCDNQQDLMTFRESRAASPAGDRMREYLGKPVDQTFGKPVDHARRGDAPAFAWEQGKAVVRNWETGAEINDFAGIAYDYIGKRFVVLGRDNGERSFNFLFATSIEAAHTEAEALKQYIASQA